MDPTKDLGEFHYNELTNEQKNEVNILIYRNNDILRNLYLGATERAVKALFLLNAGGVVTILSYIYRAHPLYAKVFLTASLVFFVSGILLVSLAVFFDFKLLYNKANEYVDDVTQYLLNEIVFSNIRYFSINNEKQPLEKWAIYMGYGSAICVLSGVFLGLSGYFIK